MTSSTSDTAFVPISMSAKYFTWKAWNLCTKIQSHEWSRIVTSSEIIKLSLQAKIVLLIILLKYNPNGHELFLKIGSAIITQLRKITHKVNMHDYNYDKIRLMRMNCDMFKQLLDMFDVAGLTKDEIVLRTLEYSAVYLSLLPCFDHVVNTCLDENMLLVDADNQRLHLNLIKSYEELFSIGDNFMLGTMLINLLLCSSTKSNISKENLISDKGECDDIVDANLDNNLKIRLVTDIFCVIFAKLNLGNLRKYSVPMEIFHKLGQLPSSCVLGYLPTGCVGIKRGDALAALNFHLLTSAYDHHYKKVSKSKVPKAHLVLPFNIMMRMLWKSFVSYCAENVYGCGTYKNTIIYDIRSFCSVFLGMFKNDTQGMDLPHNIMKLDKDCPELLSNILILYKVSEIKELGLSAEKEPLLEYLRSILSVIKDFDMWDDVRSKRNDNSITSLTSDEISYFSLALSPADLTKGTNDKSSTQDEPKDKNNLTDLRNKIGLDFTYDIYERVGVHFRFWKQFLLYFIKSLTTGNSSTLLILLDEWPVEEDSRVIEKYVLDLSLLKPCDVVSPIIVNKLSELLVKYSNMGNQKIMSNLSDLFSKLDFITDRILQLQPQLIFLAARNVMCPKLIDKLRVKYGPMFFNTSDNSLSSGDVSHYKNNSMGTELWIEFTRVIRAEYTEYFRCLRKSSDNNAKGIISEKTEVEINNLIIIFAKLGLSTLLDTAIQSYVSKYLNLRNNTKDISGIANIVNQVCTSAWNSNQFISYVEAVIPYVGDVVLHNNDVKPVDGSTDNHNQTVGMDLLSKFGYDVPNLTVEHPVAILELAFYCHPTVSLLSLIAHATLRKPSTDIWKRVSEWVGRIVSKDLIPREDLFQMFCIYIGPKELMTHFDPSTTILSISLLRKCFNLCERYTGYQILVLNWITAVFMGLDTVTAEVRQELTVQLCDRNFNNSVLINNTNAINAIFPNDSFKNWKCSYSMSYCVELLRLISEPTLERFRIVKSYPYKLNYSCIVTNSQNPLPAIQILLHEKEYEKLFEICLHISKDIRGAVSAINVIIEALEFSKGCFLYSNLVSPEKVCDANMKTSYNSTGNPNDLMLCSMFYEARNSNGFITCGINWFLKLSSLLFPITPTSTSNLSEITELRSRRQVLYDQIIQYAFSDTSFFPILLKCCDFSTFSLVHIKQLINGFHNMNYRCSLYRIRFDEDSKASGIFLNILSKISHFVASAELKISIYKELIKISTDQDVLSIFHGCSDINKTFANLMSNCLSYCSPVNRLEKELERYVIWFPFPSDVTDNDTGKVINFNKIEHERKEAYQLSSDLIQLTQIVNTHGSTAALPLEKAVLSVFASSSIPSKTPEWVLLVKAMMLACVDLNYLQLLMTEQGFDINSFRSNSRVAASRGVQEMWLAAFGWKLKTLFFENPGLTSAAMTEGLRIILEQYNASLVSADGLAVKHEQSFSVAFVSECMTSLLKAKKPQFLHCLSDFCSTMGTASTAVSRLCLAIPALLDAVTLQAAENITGYSWYVPYLGIWKSMVSLRDAKSLDGLRTFITHCCNTLIRIRVSASTREQFSAFLHAFKEILMTTTEGKDAWKEIASSSKRILRVKANIAKLVPV